jgi:predicted  nucleic acid-binding Zn-ribbon protein
MINLIELQKIDSRLQELEEKRGDLPEIVKRTRQQVAKEETRLNDLQDELEEILSNLRAIGSGLEDAREKLKKYEQQLFEVRNNREYDAMTSEIENKKMEIERLEKEQETLQQRQEVIETELETLEAKVDELSVQFAEKRKELDEKLKQTADEESKLNKKREKVVKKIRPYMLKKYERIRSAKSGLAVVPVRRDACGGCSTILPPQKLYDIKRHDDLFLCESCGRILYWEDEA